LLKNIRNGTATFSGDTCNIVCLIISGPSNSKTYWKLMKMLIKSNKPSYNLPPLRNIVDDIEADIVYDDNGKCDLFNKYFSCISGILPLRTLLEYTL
jgi:hypothetical protein